MHAAVHTLEKIAQLCKERPVRVRVGHLIDGVSDSPHHEADIVFDAKHVVSVSPHHEHPDAVLPDWTILPCLIEAHAHMFLDGAPVNFEKRDQYLKSEPQWILERAKKRWPKILQCGIGAIRDAGDRHGVGLALAREAKKHEGKLAKTPWIDSPGAAIHHRGRYGSFMAQPLEDHPSASACVDARVADGADRIKLLVSGIINFKVGQVTTPPQMPVEEVRQIVAAAQRHGRQTFAHASGSEGVENSIEGGVNTVEHGFFITEGQLAKMRDKQIAWVPTFAPVQLQIDRANELGWTDEIVTNLKRIIESHRRMLRKAHEMGVTVLAGSDAGSCGVPHGLGLLQEMHQMEQAGMPAMSVIRSATSTSARTLKFAERIGQLVPGYRSRFIFTRHDPLVTIANLQREKLILFDGEAIACPSHFTTEGL